MASPNPTVSSALAQEVADLMRHTNLDARINTWLNMAYQDVIRRLSVDTYTSGTNIGGTFSVDMSYGYVAITSRARPVALLCYDSSTAALFVPEHIEPADFRRIAYNAAASPTGNPVYWTYYDQHNASIMASVDADTESGYSEIVVWPKPSDSNMNVLAYCPELCNTPVGTSEYFGFPYAFEHVLIWGAAAIGMRALRPSLFTIYKSEYEQAFGDLQWFLGYRPDSLPVMRSVTSPYEGTSRLRDLPRIPSNI